MSAAPLRLVFAGTPDFAVPCLAACQRDNVEIAANAPEVKAQLRANTEAAITAGVFGVPTLRAGAELFWGNDASPMIEQWLHDPQRFSGAEYRRIAALPVGIERTR